MNRRFVVALTAALPLLAFPTFGSAQDTELTRKYDGTTLRVLMGSGNVWDDYREAAKEFSRQTGIEFQYTQLGYSEQYQKLILDVTSGTNAFDAYAFAYQWKNEIAPYLADLTAASSVETAPPLELDDYPGDVINVYGRVQDKLVGLPILGDVTLLVWNKAHYSAAGLDAAAMPTSWDAVAENGQKLKDAGFSGFSLPGGKSVQTAVIWMILFADAGGQYFGENFTPQFNSEAALKATRFMVENLQPLAPAGNLTWDFPEMLNGLTSGAAGQGMMWPGGFGTLLDPAQSKAATDVAWGPTPGVSMLGGWSLGVNDNSPSKEAALLYAAWLSSTEVQRKSSAPARTSVLGDPELAKVNIQFPAVLKGMSGRVTEYPPINESEQIVIMVYDEVNAALAGEKTPEQAVADLQAKVEDFVKSGGYQK